MHVDGLTQVALGVEDLDRAVAFYTEVVGLRLIERFEPPGLAFLDLGGPRLLLERGAPASLVYLAVPQIDEAVEALRAKGVAIESEPHCIHVDDAGTFGEAGVSEWMAFFRDSEGNLVGLDERRRKP